VGGLARRFGNIWVVENPQGNNIKYFSVSRMVQIIRKSHPVFGP